MIRYNWSQKELLGIYQLPLMELVFRAAEIHRQFHDPNAPLLHGDELGAVRGDGGPSGCPIALGSGRLT